MTTYIYMNDRIRQKRPRKPVIRVQGMSYTLDSNKVRIWAGGKLIAAVVYDPKRNPSPTP